MKSFLLLLSLLLTLPAFGGNDQGGGGGAKVCPSSVELYDFYEARELIPEETLAQYTLSSNIHPIKKEDLWKPDPNVSVREYLTKVLDRFESFKGPKYRKAFERRVWEVYAVIEEIGTDHNLPPTNDVSPIVPQNCKYETVVFWNDVLSKVFINKRIYKLMSSMDRAGLIIHEVIYSMGRRYNLENGVYDNTSDFLRPVVAMLFSDYEFPEYSLRFFPASNSLEYLETIPPYWGTCKIEVQLTTSDASVNLKRAIANFYVQTANGYSYLIGSSDKPAEILCIHLYREQTEIKINLKGVSKRKASLVTAQVLVNSEPFITYPLKYSETVVYRTKGQQYPDAGILVLPNPFTPFKSLKRTIVMIPVWTTNLHEQFINGIQSITIRNLSEVLKDPLTDPKVEMQKILQQEPTDEYLRFIRPLTDHLVKQVIEELSRPGALEKFQNLGSKNLKQKNENQNIKTHKGE